MTLRYGSNLGLLAGGDPGEQHYQAIVQQWRGLDALVQPSVISRVAALPTTGLQDGDRYLLTTPNANANKIARYSTDLNPAGWEYFTAKSGWVVWSAADQKCYRFKGVPLAWSEEDSIGRGTSLQALRTSADGTAVEWSTESIPLGVGQSWRDMTESRAYDTTYTNTTGRPIMVQALGGPSTANNVSLLGIVNGQGIYNSYGVNGIYVASSCFVVPHNATYRIETNITGAAPLARWRELR